MQCMYCNRTLTTLNEQLSGQCNNCPGTLNVVTLESAQLKLLEHMEDGAACPCCSQWVQAYKRRIRGNHARFLMDLVRYGVDADGGWVHYSQCFFRGRDYNYLRHFGLAMSMEEGMWKATTKGRAFVMGEVNVPDWILIYDNTILRESVHETSIQACLASGGFSYEALMEGIPT